LQIEFWCVNRLKIGFWCVNRLKKISSSDSALNATPEAVRLVAEELNSEFLGQFNNFKQWYGTKLIKKCTVLQPQLQQLVSCHKFQHSVLTYLNF
jgi:hypothetical protein